jgi:hypothetical protein
MPLSSVARAASPGGPTTARVNDAPDFATTVFSDQWDYSNLQDAHFQSPPMTNPSMSGGQLRYDAGGTYPWYDALPYFPGSTAQERDGVTHPITASYYSRVSFRLWSSVSGWGGLAWSNCDWSRNRACLGQMGFAVQAGWNVYTLSPRPDQSVMPASWTGRILSVRIIPVAGKPGAHFAVDWLRVYHPSRTVGFAVNVPTPGKPVDVYWTSGGHQSGSGKLMRVSTTTAATTAVNFPADAFPPGTYSLYAVAANGQRGAVTAPLSIETPSQPTVDSPNGAGSGDFATTYLHRPWHFTSLGQLGRHANAAPLTILSGGILMGRNAAPEINNPFFYLPNPVPIDGNTWHYLTVRVKYDGPFGLTGGPTGGCVGRLIWWVRSDNGHSTQNIQDLVLYPGWNTISVDLRTNPPAAVTDDTQWAARIGWAKQTITSLRWDPNEDESPRNWYVDSIRLARDPQQQGGADVTFHDMAAAPGETATVYLTSGRNHWDTAAASRPVIVQPGKNTVHVAARPGLYWARVETRSTVGTAAQWSIGPVRVT